MGSAVAGPTDAFAPALTLPEHELAAAVTVEANLAPIEVGHPLSLAPDLWFAPTANLTLGVIHSEASIDRVPVFFEPGESICVRLESVLCPRRYHGSGFDTLYELRRGELEVAAHARLLIRDLGPIKPAVTLGATLRWREGWLSIVADPYVQLGLWNTEDGNRTELWLPVTFAFAPASWCSFELHTGYDTDVAVWRDGYYVPLFARVHARITSHLDGGLGAGFASLLGTQNVTRERVLAIDLGWRT